MKSGRSDRLTIFTRVSRFSCERLLMTAVQFQRHKYLHVKEHCWKLGNDYITLYFISCTSVFILRYAFRIFLVDIPSNSNC